MQLALGTGVQEKHTEIERETDFIEFKKDPGLSGRTPVSEYFLFLMSVFLMSHNI